MRRSFMKAKEKIIATAIELFLNLKEVDDNDTNG